MNRSISLARLSLCLALGTISSHAFSQSWSGPSSIEGSSTHGGGEFVPTPDGGNTLLDLVNSCVWETGRTLANSVPQYSVILEQLRAIHPLFAWEMDQELSRLSVCRTENIRPIPLEDRREFTIIRKDRKQLAVRYEQFFVFDETIFETLTPEAQALTIFHEVMHSFVPWQIDARDALLRSIVRGISIISEGHLDADGFEVYLRQAHITRVPTNGNTSREAFSRFVTLQQERMNSGKALNDLSIEDAIKIYSTLVGIQLDQHSITRELFQLASQKTSQHLAELMSRRDVNAVLALVDEGLSVNTPLPAFPVTINNRAFNINSILKLAIIIDRYDIVDTLLQREELDPMDTIPLLFALNQHRVALQVAQHRNWNRENISSFLTQISDLELLQELLPVIVSEEYLRNLDIGTTASLWDSVLSAPSSEHPEAREMVIQYLVDNGLKTWVSIDLINYNGGYTHSHRYSVFGFSAQRQNVPALKVLIPTLPERDLLEGKLLTRRQSEYDHHNMVLLNPLQLIEDSNVLLEVLNLYRSYAPHALDVLLSHDEETILNTSWHPSTLQKLAISLFRHAPSSVDRAPLREMISTLAQEIPNLVLSRVTIDTLLLSGEWSLLQSLLSLKQQTLEESKPLTLTVLGFLLHEDEANEDDVVHFARILQSLNTRSDVSEEEKRLLLRALYNELNEGNYLQHSLSRILWGDNGSYFYRDEQPGLGFLMPMLHSANGFEFFKQSLPLDMMYALEAMYSSLSTENAWSVIVFNETVSTLSHANRRYNDTTSSTNRALLTHFYSRHFDYRCRPIRRGHCKWVEKD